MSKIKNKTLAVNFQITSKNLNLILTMVVKNENELIHKTAK